MSNLGIKELAKRLGISTASVSRALNKPERVSKDMRDKVIDAAKQLGYRPNRIGSSLRTSKTGNILAIIPDLSDTFNAGLIRSMEENAARFGLSMLFGNSSDLRERELRYGELVQQKQADAVIYFSAKPPFDDDQLNSEFFEPPPMVNSCEVDSLTGFQIGGNIVPFVTIDNVAASEELVSHLLSLGHSKIAIITGSMTSPSAQQRLQGYRQAHQYAGVNVVEELIYKASYSIGAGEKITREILKLSDRPTAIYCMCDESAIGCIHVLSEAGIKIPEEIAVCGFDNIRFAQYTTPPLTTVDQSIEDIGRCCIELVAAQINGEEIKKREQIMPHKLIIRESTAGASQTK